MKIKRRKEGTNERKQKKKKNISLFVSDARRTGNPNRKKTPKPHQR